jgi:hypothetical protein
VECKRNSNVITPVRQEGYVIYNPGVFWMLEGPADSKFFRKILLSRW